MDRATGDLQLIRLVRQYSFLYDTTSDNYKNIKLKETVWKKISGAVGLPVETNYVPGTPSREEPEPLSEDAMARVYGDPSGRLATSPPVEAIVGIEEEDDDDDVEEIIEHHPPDEEMADAFAKNEANGDSSSAPANGAADSVTSDGSYSPSSAAAAEPEPPRLEPRTTEQQQPPPPPQHPQQQKLERSRNSRFGGGMAAAFVNGVKREARLRQPSPEDADVLRHRDTTRDFFLYLADTVKTFPPFLQAQVKGKCFEAVNSAELTLVSRSAYNANHKFNWNA